MAQGREIQSHAKTQRTQKGSFHDKNHKSNKRHMISHMLSLHSGFPLCPLRPASASRRSRESGTRNERGERTKESERPAQPGDAVSVGTMVTGNAAARAS